MIPQLQHAQRPFGPPSGSARAEQPEEGAAFTRVFGENAPAKAPETPPESVPREAADEGESAAAERPAPDAAEGEEPAPAPAAEGEGLEEEAKESADPGDLPFFLPPAPGAGLTAPAAPQVLFAIAAGGEEGTAPELAPEGGLTPPESGNAAALMAGARAEGDALEPAVAATARAALPDESVSAPNQALPVKASEAHSPPAAPATPPTASALAAQASALPASPGLAAVITAFAPPEGRPHGSVMEAALRLHMDAGSEEGDAPAAPGTAASAPPLPAGATAPLVALAPQTTRAQGGENAAPVGPTLALRGPSPVAPEADRPAPAAAGPAPAPAESPILFTLPPAEPGFGDASPALRHAQSQAQNAPAQISLPVSALPAALLDHALQTSAGKASGGPVEVVLNPQELGRMRFEMHQQGDHMKVFLVAERPETLDLLRRHGEQLLADLRQSGFGGASLSFGSWGQQGSGPQGQILLAEAPVPEDIAPIASPPPAPRLPMPASGTGLDLRF